MVNALLPTVLRMLSPEARGLIVAVVQLAEGAHEIGPPSPPPHVEQWSRNAAGARVPWQLVAAALAVEGGGAVERVAALVAAVERAGLVPGVREWTGDSERAGAVLLAFLAFSARALDPAGLQALASTFGGG